MTSRQHLAKALGGHWHGSYGTAPCPVCQPERRRDQRALSISTGTDGRLLLRCHKTGCAFRDILAAAGVAPGTVARPDPATIAKRQAATEASAKRREGRAWRIWQESKPATGTLAQGYLRSRFLDLPEGVSIRFHPAAPHPTGARFPAMVARIDGGQGFSCHLTYLRTPGHKAETEPVKATWGLPKGGAVRLIEPPETAPLLVAEGIETALAAAVLWGGRCGAWAALSATGMAGLDPERLPTGVTVVSIGDGDKAGLWAMRKLAERAHAAGLTVKTLPAPNGLDWADVLALRVRQEGGAA